ncbi:MAG TPA: glycosyltransferase, partial [Bacteroidales bacterium]|nr:glycosyltransferase [Bacteroidales bacterium]
MDKLSFLILIIPCIYALMMIAFAFGWLWLPAYRNECRKSVSIIIAVRNEEENIPQLLQGLHLQSYPTHLLQIIIVDDHSTDRTFQLIENDPLV